jgi:hypothetical protein
MVAAVIKLLHKGGDQFLLQNWRPILLLHSPYKLIAKLISNRLKSFIPALVDKQQAGFVKGCHIEDNILTMSLV